MGYMKYQHDPHSVEGLRFNRLLLFRYDIQRIHFHRLSLRKAPRYYNAGENHSQNLLTGNQSPIVSHAPNVNFF